jgi:hypothetical protein
MTQPEYLTVLVSIIVGLGVTDLAKSIRDLLHPDRPVQWHWLPLTWAAAAILMVLVAWWAFFRVLQAEVWSSPQAFLLILVATLNLYFLCAFALPDLDGPPAADRPDPVDLESFYFSASHRRAFFGFGIAFYLFFELIIRVWRVTELGRPYSQAVENVAVNGLLFCVPYGIMVFTNRKWIHVLLTILGIAGIGFLLFGVRAMMGGG